MGGRIHDANIVATMLAYGERRLLTFNTADFRRYGDRIELLSGWHIVSLHFGVKTGSEVLLRGKVRERMQITKTSFEENRDC